MLTSLMTKIHLNAAAAPTVLWKRAHFYNNFEISHLALWRSEPYRKVPHATYLSLSISARALSLALSLAGSLSRSLSRSLSLCPVALRAIPQGTSRVLERMAVLFSCCCCMCAGTPFRLALVGIIG